MNAPAGQPLRLSPAEAESRRFSLRIVRGVATAPRACDLWPALLAHDTDVAIVRTPAGHAGCLPTLAGHGAAVIHADTLVYWHAALAGLPVLPTRNPSLHIRAARPGDLADLEHVAAAAFSAYRSHYQANPLFDGTGITAGYVQWAGQGLRDAHSGLETWVAHDGGRVVGFATCRLPATVEGRTDIVLNAVHPAHAGQGVYGDLLQAIIADSRARGISGIQSSTQVWNHGVQRAWARAGWHLASSLDTWHVNCLLDAGELVSDIGIVLPASSDAVEIPPLAALAMAFGDHASGLARGGYAAFAPLRPGERLRARLRQVTDTTGGRIRIMDLRDAAGMPRLLCQAYAAPQEGG